MIMFGQTTDHSVALTWIPSTTPGVSGYNVYRGTVSGGPYAKINSVQVPGLDFTDISVQAGGVYFYVITALLGNAESSFSGQAEALIPGSVTTNPAFVNQQYLDFLDRQADQDGLNGWVNQLNNGLSRSQLIADLTASVEFAQHGLFVAQAYRGLLVRDADYSGFRGWVSWLDSGQQPVDLVQSFINSLEFQSNFGSNLDNGQFVTRMYENVLLRQPDSGGYNYFVGQLNNGQMTRAQVGLALLQSSEFQNLASTQHRVSISLLYFDMLRRQPDSGGFNGWVTAVNSGSALTDVINVFLNSAEYSSRFQ